jgi:hypothetical protein
VLLLEFQPRLGWVLCRVSVMDLLSLAEGKPFDPNNDEDLLD